MKKSYDTEQINDWLDRENIRECFDTQDLSFYICYYEKGEYLTAPDRHLDNLLFVVSGMIQIYCVRDDGSISPVNQMESPALIGDIEFTRQTILSLFTEAKTAVTCIALPVSKYRKQLECDLRFLHMLIQSYADKLYLFTSIEVPVATIEERVILYMKNFCPSHELDGIELATNQIRCSRRQLQRVLKKLCENGKIEKTGKGKYRLAEGMCNE